jgi:hypothetical protein
VLAIGVGSYPHLLGGSKTLANNPIGLRQLASPPASVEALLEWFLAPSVIPGAVGFTNRDAALASVEALASSTPALVIKTPRGDVLLDPATRQNIQAGFQDWLARLQGHPENVGVFYFCGHGLMVSEHYLLTEDFGCDAQPWAQAFDITTTIRALEREVEGTIYYFIDACREISRDLRMTLGVNPNALWGVDLTKRVIRKSVTAVFATGEGQLAFAPQGGKVSRFTSALLCALSGYCGTKTPGETTWSVDGEGIATAIRQLLEYDALTAAGQAASAQQVSEQSVRGTSVPLLRMATAPKVKVWLDLTPSQRRALYEIYLESHLGNRMAQTLLNQVFTTDVPRGFYKVGADDPAGALPAVVHPDEELVPPMYAFTMQSQP